jgi:hypothetical protein
MHVILMTHQQIYTYIQSKKKKSRCCSILQIAGSLCAVCNVPIVDCPMLVLSYMLKHELKTWNKSFFFVGNVHLLVDIAPRGFLRVSELFLSY